MYQENAPNAQDTFMTGSRHLALEHTFRKLSQKFNGKRIISFFLIDKSENIDQTH